MRLPTFDLRLMASFAVLGEELHFGRAAQRLGMGQPALSQQISRLERQLGVQLLVRGGRRVELSPPGARFLIHCREAVATADRAAAGLHIAEGELAVSPGDASHPRVRELLSSFMAAHPAVRVALPEHAMTHGIEAVRLGRIDVSFGMAERLPPGLSYLPVGAEPLGVVCPARHRFARQDAVAWSSLEDELVILAPLGIADGYNDLLRDSLRRFGVQATFSDGPPVDKAQYVLGHVAAGPGLVVTNRYNVNPLRADLAWVRLDPDVELVTGAIWDPRNDRDAVRRFVRWVEVGCAEGATA